MDDRQEAVRERIAAKDEAALRFVMACPAGRWFVSRILKSCHVDEVLGLVRRDGTMVLDERVMMMQEGERRVGLNIKKNIKNLSDGRELYQKMEEEAEEYDRQLAEAGKAGEEQEE